MLLQTMCICLRWRNCLWNAGNKEKNEKLLAQANREIVHLIPDRGVFRIHEEDGRLNRCCRASAVVDNGGQSHIYLQ